MRLISGTMRSILPSEMPSSRFSALGRRATLGIALLSVSACKTTKEAQTPEPALDDITAIEAELAANADRLLAQGVAPATTKSDPSEDEGAVAPTEPVAPDDPEPEPAPEPAPMAEAAEESESDARPVFDSSRRSKAKKNRRREEPTRCERICQLEDSTCDLAERICALADEHVDDVRYDEACERAESQCEAATDACTNCED